MFSLNHKTIMDTIIESTFNDFVEQNNKESHAPLRSDSFMNGDILYRTPINKSYMNDIINDTCQPVIESERNNQRISHYDVEDSGLFENVTKDIIKLNINANFTECLNEIKKYKDLLKNNFYGALLRSTVNKNIILNPFHILTTLSILDKKNIRYFEEETYDVIIFAYTNRAEMDKSYKSNLSDTDKCNRNIDSIINTYGEKIENNLSIIAEITPDKQTESITIKKKLVKYEDEDINSAHYIIATQIMTKGIIAPYYATSLLRLDNDTAGMHLGPQKSCNIAASRYSLASSSPRFEDVCTGDYNNQSFRGLRTLSHANYSSAYSGDFIMAGALAYIDIMIQRSEELYIAAEILNPIEIVEIIEPQWTDEQLASSNFYQFIHVSDINIDIKELNIMYKKMKEDRLQYSILN